ncbi:hypothetical protein HPB49_003773 [Dermacentor silvarum]|uniref:Uncharacterized protein n=1 Tax=Dermacentor silvarum TaxID=543639 RepID=A0ACB8C136_DERSI|nr:hypothetical protein HPB49_003773 [Dermacentor silvarum]
MAQSEGAPVVSAAVSPTHTAPKKQVTPRGAVVGISCALFASVGVFALIWLSVRLVAFRRNDTVLRETPFCCPKEAAALFAVIDHKAAPCVDFFAHVCRNAIEQGFTQENAGDDILWEILAHIITGTSNYGVKAAAALQAFYRSCITEIWQPELRLRGTLAAVLEFANTKNGMSPAQLLRFALEVQTRYNLIFYFTIVTEGVGIYFERNMLRIAAYEHFCDKACYAIALSTVNAHFGVNCTNEQMSAWEKQFRDGYSLPQTVALDEIRAAFGGMGAEEFKTIFQEFFIDIDAAEFILADPKTELFDDIERLWDVANQPLSLCHVLVIIALDTLRRVVHDEVTLNAPTVRSREVCEFHLSQSPQLWQVTNVAALTSPHKDLQVRSIFEATRRSFLGYQPLRRLMTAGNDTVKFESLVRNVSLLLPADLVLPQVKVPVLNDSGFVRNIFHLISFEYDTKVEKLRRGLPVFHGSSPELMTERMLFVKQRTLYVTAPAYAWLSTGTTNPVLADAPVIASRMASLMWQEVYNWEGWSDFTWMALYSFRGCVIESEGLQDYDTGADLFALTMGLRIAAIVATTSYGPGDATKAQWFRIKRAWSLYRTSEAQFFYARYAYFRCSGDNAAASVNGPTRYNADFAIAFRCQPGMKSSNDSGCADVATTGDISD